jgi:hypothetical protein
MLKDGRSGKLGQYSAAPLLCDEAKGSLDELGIKRHTPSFGSGLDGIAE